jgi:hypothetical protein
MLKKQSLMKEKRLKLNSMNHQDFNLLLEDIIDKTKKVLWAKSDEYSTKEDKLHNFKKAARIANNTPEQALKGMLLKHEVSISDMVEQSASDPDKITIERVQEKIGDNINYLILLAGLFIERINERNKKG